MIAPKGFDTSRIIRDLNEAVEAAGFEPGVLIDRQPHPSPPRPESESEHQERVARLARRSSHRM